MAIFTLNITHHCFSDTGKIVFFESMQILILRTYLLSTENRENNCQVGAVLSKNSDVRILLSPSFLMSQNVLILQTLACLKFGHH